MTDEERETIDSTPDGAARDDAALLAAYLATRDLPCPVCKYNLRANISPCCPECGAEIQLRIGSPDLKMAGWITALLCLALPLGFTGTLSIVLIVVLVFFGAQLWGGIGGAEFVIFVMTAVYGGGVYGLIRTRSRFWRASLGIQLPLILLCALTGVGGVAIFILLAG